MKRKKILVVDDEPNMRHMLSLLLRGEGYEVEEASNGREAIEKMGGEIYDSILCDIRMPDMDGMEFLNALGERKGDAPIIMMSAYGTIDTAIEAMKAGAYDYISKPFKADEILLTLKKAEEREKLRRENIRLKEELTREYSFANMVGKSEKMRETFDIIKKVCEFKTTVLIQGESGTGKELIARAIHYNGPRAKGPFVAINCGAIPQELLESELFGHVKGAFTHAIRSKKGLFEEADGGSLFLDEIGELPHHLQVKLLRALQDEEIRRIGDARPIPVDVRIIAATVHNLSDEVIRGRFREDLFYRLNVLCINVPPLRERREDIPYLVDHFIKKNNQKLGLNVEGVTNRAMERLIFHSWPGNVRELENTIERAMILCEGKRIDIDDLSLDKERGISNLSERGIGEVLEMNHSLSIKEWSREIEKRLILKALERTEGNRTKAARLLEISHRALLYKIREYGIRYGPLTWNEKIDR
jgi:two-component system response regulator AtoC